MRRILATLFILACAAPARAAGTGVEALGRLVGTWQSSATATDTPYSKAALTTGTTTCEWSESHDFLICRQTVASGATTTKDLAVYTYDTAASKYHFYAIRTNGVSDVGITVDTDSIVYTSTFTDGPKNVTVRTLNVWSDPEHYRFWTEYTTDGTHWTRMLAGETHRVAATPATSPPPKS